MNYKILIILLALLFLVILVYQEVSSLKNEFINNMKKLTSDLKDNSNFMVTKLQNNMIKCVGQIKNISSDNIYQLRKISELNKQPITRMSCANHFTETDASEIQTDINYLSDVQNYDNVIQKTKNPMKKSRDMSYYMSEATDKSSNAEPKNKSKDKSQYEQCVDGVCKIKTNDSKDIPIYVSKVKEDIPIYHSKSNNSSPNININDNINASFIDDDELSDEIEKIMANKLSFDGRNVEVDIYRMIADSNSIFSTLPINVIATLTEAINDDTNLYIDSVNTSEDNKAGSIDDTKNDVEEIDLSGSLKDIIGSGHSDISKISISDDYDEQEALNAIQYNNQYSKNVQELSSNEQNSNDESSQYASNDEQSNSDEGSQHASNDEQSNSEEDDQHVSNDEGSNSDESSKHVSNDEQGSSNESSQGVSNNEQSNNEEDVQEVLNDEKGSNNEEDGQHVSNDEDSNNKEDGQDVSNEEGSNNGEDGQEVSNDEQSNNEEDGQEVSNDEQSNNEEDGQEVLDDKQKDKIKKLEKNLKISTTIFEDRESSNESTYGSDLASYLDEITKASDYTSITIGTNETNKTDDSNSSLIKKVIENKLGKITEYDANELKKIAKYLHIPLTYKKGNARRYYKKQELYKNIKKKLKTHKQ